MRSEAVKLVAAVSVSVLDGWVAKQCGPVVWSVYGGVPLLRIGILLIAGGIAFTLTDIWSKTISSARTPGAIRSVKEMADV